MFAQLTKVLYMIKQGDSSSRQNGRSLLMLLSTNFTEKLELLSLTQKNIFFQRLCFKFNIKNIDSPKQQY